MDHYSIALYSTTPRSYTLLLSVPGEDLNKAWPRLNDQQYHDVVYQVAGHVHTLAQLQSEKLESADKKWMFEPWLMLSKSHPDVQTK